MITNCQIGNNVVFEDKKTIILKDCIIGDNCFIAAYTKIINVQIGDDCKVYSFVNLYGPDLIIKEHCKIGTFVEITRGVYVGPNSVISSHTFICEGVTLVGNNFIGHSVSFTNDKNPQSFNPEFKLEKTIIKFGAVIGTGSSILPVTIGKYATIGAGSIVTKDIPDYGLAYSEKAQAITIKIKSNG